MRSIYDLASLVDARRDITTERDDAQSLLASICDTINTWCREANHSECHEYLTYALRDHIRVLWGSLNRRDERSRAQRDSLLAAAREMLVALSESEGDDYQYHATVMRAWGRLDSAVEEVEA